MVVVADGVEVVNAATGEREGTLERGGHGVDLGFRRGEEERVEWKAEVTGGYEVEDVAGQSRSGRGGRRRGWGWGWASGDRWWGRVWDCRRGEDEGVAREGGRRLRRREARV